jgi:UPF0755 protein
MTRVTYYKVHSPSKSRLHKAAYILIVLIIILFVATIYVRRYYDDNLKPVSNSQQSKLVVIKDGTSMPEIASKLKSDGLIRATWSFEWYVRNDNFARDNLEAGTYSFRPNQSVQTIVNQLTEGRTALNLVVILPGQRLDQIVQGLINAGFKKTDVEEALNPSLYSSKYPMLSGIPAGGSLEGFLYPDSFAKDSSTKVGTIINESLQEMQSKLNYGVIAGFTAQGLSIYQGVTLASIVEQEVSNASDKPIVAQVFLSRLKAGMNLGSDATADYGAIVDGQTPSVSVPSPYNTLLNPGLPPGPISNVSESSINAVAHPASTNYLYFVTGDNGVTYYSQTLQQHDQQVQLYCQKLCSNASA